MKMDCIANIQRYYRKRRRLLLVENFLAKN